MPPCREKFAVAELIVSKFGKSFILPLIFGSLERFTNLIYKQSVIASLNIVVHKSLLNLYVNGKNVEILISRKLVLDYSKYTCF